MAMKSEEKKFILEFIEVYRSLSSLWDMTSKDYTNPGKKSEQYDVLVEKYREKYPNADKQEVVKKTNSLRTNFLKKLKRIREAEKSGAGADDVELTLWYFEEMQFLRTRETPTTSTSTMDSMIESPDADESDDDTTDNAHSQAAISN